jgi:hypothetical protein
VPDKKVQKTVLNALSYIKGVQIAPICAKIYQNQE